MCVMQKLMEEQIDPHLAHIFLNAVTLHRTGLQSLQPVMACRGFIKPNFRRK